jgi:hypothetical protein
MTEELTLPADFKLVIHQGMMTRTSARQGSRLNFVDVLEILQTRRIWSRTDRGFQHISDGVQIEVFKIRHSPAEMIVRSQAQQLASFNDEDFDGPVGLIYQQLFDQFRAMSQRGAKERESSKQQAEVEAEGRLDKAAEDLKIKFNL